ncbi:hypothetical protein AU210_015807 [Fusarium oxysporum f. sp. radicis-cucumerinum]|uniref:Uncharacterized protein n=1 Tax=Fusarium oxysporum f. sp. radicis-cucumerinum TaxID=327505 RepID=A0A2H3FRH1_FUSOX|nr:hypothetical protein AU210_015807 [Fusarium oxysporum f. sp. radicis-cucumerinum]
MHSPRSDKYGDDEIESPELGMALKGRAAVAGPELIRARPAGDIQVNSIQDILQNIYKPLFLKKGILDTGILTGGVKDLP